MPSISECHNKINLIPPCLHFYFALNSFFLGSFLLENIEHRLEQTKYFIFFITNNWQKHFFLLVQRCAPNFSFTKIRIGHIFYWFWLNFKYSIILYTGSEWNKMRLMYGNNILYQLFNEITKQLDFP